MTNDTQGTRGGLSDAVRSGEWARARHLAAVRVAEAMERTQSARDIKALALSLDKLLADLETHPSVDPDSPLARIMAEADALESSGRS